MQEGVSAAYKAVMKPAEGTVLTVSRLAAKQAVDTAAAGETDLERVLEDAIRVGYAALAQTTEMNPVLKKAGVVDAGGKGYLLILEGMLAELRGEPMPETARTGESREEKADFATHGGGGDHLRLRHGIHRPQGHGRYLAGAAADISQQHR